MALDESGWSTPRPGRFAPGNDSVSIVQEAGWAPGPVWTDAENLAPTGIRSPDRPARSESLYLLSYPGPYILYRTIRFTGLSSYLLYSTSFFVCTSINVSGILQHSTVCLSFCLKSLCKFNIRNVSSSAKRVRQMK
jgi:hypothetical protein